MATRNYTWVTAPSGTEGTTTVYVDADFGSDVTGDGTRQRPYQTLTKGYNAKTTRPTTIVCRGTFCEQIANGNHSAAINGDYWGAATFDGQGQFLIYGFTHNKMIIRNVPIARGDETVWSGSPLLAGVGRAINAGAVGYAVAVSGVAGSSVCLHKTALYYGYIGGNTAVERVVYDSPLHNTTYLLKLAGRQNEQMMAGRQNEQMMKNCTVYGVPSVADRAKAQYGSSIVGTIFSRFAMVGNELLQRTYTRCVFAADVTWWWLTATNGNSGTPEQLVLTGETSAEREQSLLAQLEAKGLADNLMPIFEDCVFSEQSADEIFNGAESGDFTLIPGCDADWQTASGTYCGALPPAINIPVLEDSTARVGTWDERSVSGCLSVETKDGVTSICFDTDSPSEEGEIYSKIITVDPTKVQLSSVWSEVASRMRSYGVRMWKENIMGDTHVVGDTLPIGHYVVRGDGFVVWENNLVAPGGTIFVTTEGTTFSMDDPTKESKLDEIIDPSMMDVVYCRCRSVVYARVGVNDDLQLGATYLNDGASDIVYHNRRIVPGESFVCMWSGERFTCADATQKIAVMFDDTRVPTAEWIPAATMAEYFVGKSGGAIIDDAYGVPYSSGNVRSYAQTLAKSTMDRRYVQFCIKVRSYGTGEVI